MGGPNMSGLGGQTCLANASRTRSGDRICPENPGKLGCRKDFEDLHFTNSLDASPLIVRSFYDTNKIKSP
jgi:hypothetical protein